MLVRQIVEVFKGHLLILPVSVGVRVCRLTNKPSAVVVEIEISLKYGVTRGAGMPDGDINEEESKDS